MSNQGLVVTRRLYYVIIIVMLINIGLFFTSPNAHNIWPIGVVLELLSLGSIQIGTFYENSLVVERPFFFSKKKIEYSSIIKFRINPAILTTPPVVILLYQSNGKRRKISLPIYLRQGDTIRTILLTGNPNIKEEIAFGESLK